MSELDQLRASLEWERDNETRLFNEKAALRNIVIEECARVAESFQLAGAIAAAIRALKDKP